MRFLLVTFIAAGIATRTEAGKTPVSAELAVTFKKGISLNKAKRLLDRLQVEYREGADSSRGKTYFYRTGPKFIVHVSQERMPEIEAKLKSESIIFEVYYPDWTKQKD